MIITAEPRSDQWNADDFVQGPRTFTIAGVTLGKAEQKYDIALEGSTRVWRPPVTVQRILLAAWKDDAAVWVGHQVTLYRDDSIRFGPKVVGGIRVSHLSHIDKPLSVLLGDARGSRKNHTIQPLVHSAPENVHTRDWLAELAQTTTLDQVAALGTDAAAAHAPDTILVTIRARYSELRNL